MSGRAMMRAWAAALMMSCIAVPAWAQEGKKATLEPGQLKTLREEALGLRDAVVRAAKEPAAFTPDEAPVVAHAKKLNDPEILFDWVRGLVRLEPYEGILRGPRGALESGAGNAAEIAGLLAMLCRDAGWEVRLIHGTLTEAAAKAALEQVVGRAKLAGELGQETSWQPAARHLDALRDHTWVEVRRDGQQGWLTLDPVTSEMIGITGGKSTGATLKTAKQDSEMALVLEAELDNGGKRVLAEIKGELGELAYKPLTMRFEPEPRLKGAMRVNARVGDKVIKGDAFNRDVVRLLTLRIISRVGRRRDQSEQVMYRRGVGAEGALGADQLHIAMAVLPGWTTDPMVGRIGEQELVRAAQTVADWAQLRTDSNGRPDVEMVFNKKISEMLDHGAAVVPWALARHIDRVTPRAAASFGVAPILAGPRVFVVATTRRGQRFVVEGQLHADGTDAAVAKGLPEVMGRGFLTYYGPLEDALIGATLKPLSATTPTTLRSLLGEQTLLTAHMGGAKELKDSFKGPVMARKLIERLVQQTGGLALVSANPREGRLGWWFVDPLTGGLRAMRYHGLFEDVEAEPIEDQAAQARAVLIFIARVASTWLTALRGMEAMDQVACEAMQETVRLGSGVCDGKVRVDIASCIAGPKPYVGDDPLAIHVPTCAEVAEPVACGAVMAAALLSGGLSIEGATPLAPPLHCAP
jgi:hypothetical protein